MTPVKSTLSTRLSRAVLLAALTFSVQGFAADTAREAQLKALEFALAQANLAQQSVHTQFQMILEIRKSEADRYRIAVPDGGVAGPPRNFDDLQQMRVDNEQRQQQATEELNRLYSRYNDIEQDKDRLREQIRVLLESR